jgi:hypothetical protein
MADKKKDKELVGTAFVGSFFLGFALGILLNNWNAVPFLAVAFAFIGYTLAGMRLR